MNSRHYAPPLFHYSAIPIPPFRQSTIPPFHKSVPISRNYCISPHFNDADVLVRCKEKHLCTLLVVFGVTDLCLLRKPNISYLDSFQTLWINVANLPMLLMMNMMSLPLPKSHQINGLLLYLQTAVWQKANSGSQLMSNNN